MEELDGLLFKRKGCTNNLWNANTRVAGIGNGRGTGPSAPSATPSKQFVIDKHRERG